MFNCAKAFLIFLAATAIMSSSAGSAENSQARLLFSGFLGDGAVYSTYGYSRQSRRVYASFHVELPGMRRPLDVTRRLPAGAEDGSSAIKALYLQAYAEVSHILSRHGGVKEGYQTFSSENGHMATAVTDGSGNHVEIKSGLESVKECRNPILNDTDYVGVELNGHQLSIHAESRLCLTRGYVTGMWSKTKDAPVTVVSFLFFAEDGDQHVFLVHHRQEDNFFRQISNSLK